MKDNTYKNFEDLPLMLSVQQLAAALGISKAGAYELVKAKNFPAINIGTRIVIPKEQFIEWINKKVSENI